MNKKIYLLNLYPHKHRLISIIVILVVLTIIPLSNFIKLYDSYYTTGLISCNEECSITVSLPYDKVDILKQNPHLEYLNKEYKINKITYNEPYIDNQIPYEDVIIYTDLNSEDKIINFKILYNKQRIISKVKKMIKGE